MKTVKFLLNIGTADQRLLRLNEAYLDGQVVEVGDTEADILVRRGWARLFDQKEEDANLLREQEAAIAAAMPAARLELAKEKAKQAAVERIKAAEASPAKEAKQAGPVPSPAALENAAEAARKLDNQTDESEADSSPVSEDNAHEAIDQISRMRSPEKLQTIIDTDDRETVKRAAQKRLDELNAK
jgi:hypothetical protein